MSEAPLVLEAVNVHRRFVQGQEQVPVLQGVNLQVRAGHTVALLGASGSGKSTLLHVLAGLEAPDEGQVRLQGRDWADMNTVTQGQWRNVHLGFVYQFHHLLPEFSALDNVAMPLRIRRVPVAAARAQAQAALDSVGLDHRLQHRPAELSGGERQRVAVARALVGRPACVLADEPTGNLDRATAQGVFRQLLERAQADGTAVLVVTHDESLASRCAQRWRMVNGQVLGEAA